MARIKQLFPWFTIGLLIVAVTRAIYWLHYQALIHTIPYPADDVVAPQIMAQEWFIEARTKFYQQQTPVMALLTAISIVLFHLVWRNDQSRTGRFACFAIVWATFWSLSAVVIWVAALYPLLLGVIVAFLLFARYDAQRSWKSVLVAFVLNVIWLGYTFQYGGESYGVFGD